MAILLIYFTNFLLPLATNASNMLPNSKNAPGSGTSETGGHFYNRNSMRTFMVSRLTNFVYMFVVVPTKEFVAKN
jgi:hypothetical protein